MKIKNTERRFIAHALDHLNQNKIANEGYGGWYMGNRDSFIKRHKQTIEFLESLLESPEKNK
jgi:hypothetical protein